MAKNEELSSRIRQRIQDSMERAEEERKREMFKRRLDIARAGLSYYEQKKIKDAVQQFHLYLRILEEGKKVPEGGLNPSYFDKKEDVHELLLISGVYWDLAKIYDRTESKERKKDLQHYLDKYVIFSKGMPYAPVCGETLRKYISNEKPIHKEEFKKTYLKLAGGKCFVATALFDHLEPQTLPRLYFFRDEILKRTTLGRTLIWVYYQIGPILAFFVLKSPRAFQALLGKCIDWIGKKGIENGKTG